MIIVGESSFINVPDSDSYVINSKLNYRNVEMLFGRIAISKIISLARCQIDYHFKFTSQQNYDDFEIFVKDNTAMKVTIDTNTGFIVNVNAENTDNNCGIIDVKMSLLALKI